jgi:hypothetical protein
VATTNPGLAYVAVAWQLAAEVIVPLNREAGNSTGFRAQLLFFLDDLIPKLFDKPLLSDKPDRSLIAWHGFNSELRAGTDQSWMPNRESAQIMRE